MSTTIEAVAELIRTQKLRIEVTPTVAYWVKAPCLLSQIEAAKAGGMETGGRGIPASRSPLAIEAFDLWYKITYNTHGLAHHLGLNRRDTTPESQTPWVGRLLRHCAATAVSKGLTKTADRIEFNAKKWTVQIGGMLSGKTEQRALRGAQCSDCSATTVVEERWGDGTYRVPAIIVVTYNTLRWLVCQACGWSDPLVTDEADDLVYTSEDAL